jgi:hypothetical protein
MKRMRQVHFLVSLYQRGIVESSILTHWLKSPMYEGIEKNALQ